MVAAEAGAGGAAAHVYGDVGIGVDEVEGVGGGWWHMLVLDPTLEGFLDGGVCDAGGGGMVGDDRGAGEFAVADLPYAVVVFGELVDERTDENVGEELVKLAHQRLAAGAGAPFFAPVDGEYLDVVDEVAAFVNEPSADGRGGRLAFKEFVIGDVFGCCDFGDVEAWFAAKEGNDPDVFSFHGIS